MPPKPIGFDFGTTNSLVSIIINGKATNFLGDDGLPVPSVVCYDGDMVMCGRDAKRLLDQHTLGVNNNIIRSPKMLANRESLYVAGVEKPIVDVISDLVAHILDEANRDYVQSHMTPQIDRKPADIRSGGAVITIPINMRGHERRTIRQACAKAGLRIDKFIHEPFAALYGTLRADGALRSSYAHHGKLMLVADWGGGTLDLNLCKVTDGKIIQIASDGTDECGGDKFDHIIREYIKGHKGVESAVQPGAEARLIERCERAKIDLSKKDKALVYVSNYYQGLPDNDVECAISRQKLEEMVRPMVRKAFARLKSMLSQVGCSPEQIAHCLVIGGLSKMPMIQQGFAEMFGVKRLLLPTQDPATIVANGAAWIGNDDVNLVLAKDIELMLARGDHIPVMKADSPMPSQGKIQSTKLQLYCTDPRDGVAKFQICTSQQMGSQTSVYDMRTNLANITVAVDRGARPFKERLELRATIDDDLILKVRASSLQDSSEEDIHNLEFGVPLPPKGGAAEDDMDGATDPKGPDVRPGNDVPPQKGGLSVRQNVARIQNDFLVPGELLYTYKPGYFDMRRMPPPPEIQVAERLYYEPCARCGRDSHDPDCTCISKGGSPQSP